MRKAMVSGKTYPLLALLLGCLTIPATAGARSTSKIAPRSAEPMNNHQVIYCGNKTPERVRSDFSERALKTDVLIGTKATRAQFDALQGVEGLQGKKLEFDAISGVITFQRKHIKPQGRIVVTTAGTADIPVAEEAARVAEAMGNKVVRRYDCGVNKPERVSRNKRAFNNSNAVIAVAGMEGGLPNAVAALTDRPVIAVPTSVGYGTGLGGLAAMTCMLNACSPGISVVNIDNGFGAAFVADRINKQSVGGATRARAK